MSELFCPACRRAPERFERVGVRPTARCPRCQALERHRLLALLVDLLEPWLTSRVGTVVDLAPTAIVRRLVLDRIAPPRYVAADLSPGRDIDLRADVTALPLPDDFADLVVCYHVLEHVPEEGPALAELTRVLRPAGMLLLQVPRQLHELTDDGPSVHPERPEVRFGQDDHVRWYGIDLEARLRAGGLASVLLRPQQVFDGGEMVRFGLDPHEEVWLCRRREGAARPGGGFADLLRSLLAGQQQGRRVADDRERVRGERDAVAEERDRLRERLAAAEDELDRVAAERDDLAGRLADADARVEDLEESYERLAGHPVVRALRAVRAAGRRATGRG